MEKQNTQPAKASSKADGTGSYRHLVEVWGAMALFFLPAIMLGSLLVRIPDIKDAAGINKAELAIGLLGASIGSLVMLPVAGMFAARLGMRLTLLLAFPVYATATVALGLVASLPALFTAMALLGSSMAFTEVGMNVNASNVEKRHGILIMGKAHGFWALGQVAGSLVGVWFLSAKFGVFAATGACAVIALPVALAISMTVPLENKVPLKTMPGKFQFRLPTPALFVLGFFLFGMAMAEGAVLEWSVLYMEELVGKGATAGYAITCFSVTFAVMRFACDRLKNHIGARTLGRLSAIIAIIGLALVISRYSVAAVFLGIAILGVGLAAGFPLAMSEAGQKPGKPTHHVALMSFMAVFAFMAGPVMIGFIGEATELRFGLATLIPVLILSLACAGTLGNRPGGKVQGH